MIRVTGRVCKGVGVGVGICGFAMAHAGDTITWNGDESPGLSVTVNLSGSSVNNLSTNAGFLQFNETGSQTGLNNPFEAVCGDLIDQIGSGQTYNDTVRTSPFDQGGIPAFTTANQMLAAGKIVGNQFDITDAGGIDGSSGSPTNAENEAGAGLQLAVWAAMYDSDVNFATTSFTQFKTMIQTTGPFTISNLAGGNATLANAALADAYADWETQGTTPGAGDTTLFLQGGNFTGAGGGNTSKFGQSQWTESSSYPSGAPEPFTMGIGIAGVAFAVRRKVKRSK